MIQPREALRAILGQARPILAPKLQRLLNPNVVDARVGLSLHFKEGALNHLREVDSQPSYVANLPDYPADDPAVSQALNEFLETIARRVEPCLQGRWYGTLTVSASLSGGKAQISSEADWVHTPMKRGA